MERGTIMDAYETRIIDNLIDEIGKLIDYRDELEDYEIIDHYALVFLEGLIKYMSDNLEKNNKPSHKKALANFQLVKLRK